MSREVLFGAIADDFTGATDLAGVLVEGGMRTVLSIGVPETEVEWPDCDAVVIALKSRTAPAADAVSTSLRALAWLRERHAQQIFFKICSTFDSTPQGNIGPVADALLNELGATVHLICPAYPANLRTVYCGHLFVGDTLLCDSAMRHHPLTPMRDANLVRVLAQQSRLPVARVPREVVSRGHDAIAKALASASKNGPMHLLADAIDDNDLLALGRACANLPLLTGSAALALGLPDNFRRAGGLSQPAATSWHDTDRGGAAVLAGSCSEATRAQVAYFSARVPSVVIDPLSAADPERLAVLALAALDQSLTRGQTVLISSSIEPEAVAAVQSRLGQTQAANLVERTFALLAQKLVARDIRRLVVAGGETSGAVVGALGVSALEIGPQIHPGVPWTRVLGEAPLFLALKSGNFGNPEFFEKALEILR